MSVLKRNTLKEKFAQIPNELITDTEISINARLVYCYIASKSEGWNLLNDEMCKKLGIKSKDSVAKYLKELISKGWLIRQKQKDNKTGKYIGGYDYELLDKPNNSNSLNLIPKVSESGKFRNQEEVRKPTNTNLITNTNIITNNKEKEIYKEKESSSEKRFVKPSIEELSAYANEKGYKIDVGYFFDFYESKGWVVGKSPMKDWKAAVRTWVRNRNKFEPNSSSFSAVKSDQELDDYIKSLEDV